MFNLIPAIAATNGGNPLFSLLIFGAVIIIFFVVTIIPQRKRDKQAREQLNSLKNGDRIRTIGGVYGTICAVKEDFITIEVGPDKVRLVFLRGAVATIEPAESADDTVKELEDGQDKTEE